MKQENQTRDGGKRRYGLYPSREGMSDPQRKSLARWANAFVALMAAAVLLLVVAGATGSSGLTVTFDSQGGSAAQSQSVPYGGLAAPPEAVARPGYTLTGWSRTPDGSEPWDFAADPVTEALTLYAVWAESR